MYLGHAHTHKMVGFEYITAVCNLTLPHVLSLRVERLALFIIHHGSCFAGAAF